MHDLNDHYYSAVGEILDHAAIGHFTVRLTFADGQELEGVPAPTSEGLGDELDDTGYRRRLWIDDTAIELAQVRRATLIHPS